MYEYKCRQCGSVSEHLVGVGSDQPEISCTSCGSQSLQQLISLVSVTVGGERFDPGAMCCRGERDAGDCGGECACAYN